MTAMDGRGQSLMQTLQPDHIEATPLHPTPPHHTTPTPTRHHTTSRQASHTTHNQTHTHNTPRHATSHPHHTTPRNITRRHTAPHRTTETRFLGWATRQSMRLGRKRLEFGRREGEQWALAPLKTGNSRHFADFATQQCIPCHAIRCHTLPCHTMTTAIPITTARHLAIATQTRPYHNVLPHALIPCHIMSSHIVSLHPCHL